MKKKIFALLLALALVLGLAACGSKNEDSGEPAPSLEDFFAQLQGSYEGLDSMMALEGENLDALYPGLSGIDTESVLVQETMMSIANCAVGLVTLPAGASEEDLQAVKDVFQARMDAQAAGGAWYPESCATWEQGIVTSAGRTVGMFVYPEKAQSMADDFAETFGQ